MRIALTGQTFEILVGWLLTNDWGEALSSVIPRRKWKVGGKDTFPGAAAATSGQAPSDDEGTESDGEGEQGGVGAVVVDAEALEAAMDEGLPQAAETGAI